MEGHTIEDYFEEDMQKIIPWRLICPGNSSKAEDAMIDFNYVGICGKYKEVVCKRVAEFCKPRIGVNEVDAELAAGTDFFISVNQVLRVSKSFFDDIVVMRRGELKRDKSKTKIPVVVRDFSNDYVYVAVEALNYITEDLLLEAIKTCLHDACTPQVILTGMHENRPHPDKDKAAEGLKMHYNCLYKTMEISPYMLAMNVEGKSFSVPDVMFVPEVNAQIMGKPTSHMNRATRAAASIHIREDLDDYGHRLHHYRSGCKGDHLNSHARQTTSMQRIREYIVENHSRMVKVEVPSEDGKHLQTVSRRAYNVTVRVVYPDESMDQFDEAYFKNTNERNFMRSQDYRDAFYQKEVQAYKDLPPNIRANVPPPMAPRETMVKNGHIDCMLYGLMPGIDPEDMVEATRVRNEALKNGKKKHWSTIKKNELKQSRMTKNAGVRQYAPHYTVNEEQMTARYSLYYTLNRQQTEYLKIIEQAKKRKQQQQVQEEEENELPRVQVLDDEGGIVINAEPPLPPQKHNVYEDGFVVVISGTEQRELYKKVITAGKKRTERGELGDGNDVGYEQHHCLHEDNTNSSHGYPDGDDNGHELGARMLDEDATRTGRFTSSSSSSNDMGSMLRRTGKKATFGTKKKIKRTTTTTSTDQLIDQMLMMNGGGGDEDGED